MSESASEELDVGSLYVEYGSFLSRTIERLTGAGGHVDDLLQETFVTAFRKRKSYDRTRAAPATWLYGIAANLCRRHHRSAKRLATLKAKYVLEQVGQAQTRPDQLAEEAQRVQMVYEVMQKLPFKQREVFSLYELEALDGNAIASMLGIPLGTVWTRLHHARQRFAKLMQTRLEKEGLA